MRHEKIFKTDQGRVKVCVHFESNSYIYSNQDRWSFTVLICDKGKRTFKGFEVDYEHRYLNMEERANKVKQWSIEQAGKDRIMQTMNELYEMMKPEI